jgi:hypothetical protein
MKFTKILNLMTYATEYTIVEKPCIDDAVGE